MSRFTITDLREGVRFFNARLIADGHNMYFVEQGRNGYQAVDAYTVRPDGSVSCHHMVGGGTSREVHSYMETEFYQQLNRKPSKLTRKQCKRMLILLGADFGLDFHEKASTNYAGALEVLAKLSGYRKSKTAPCSLGRAFYEHLQRKVAL